MQADPSIFANGAKNMTVDYVRVYAKDGVKGNPAEVVNPPLKLYTMEQGTATLTNGDAGAHIEITSTGNQPYSVMAAKEGIEFKAGKTYDIDITVSPERARDVEITLEDSEYTRYFDETFPVTFFDDRIHFQYAPTVDRKLDLKIMLGNVNGSTGTNSINIYKLSISDNSQVGEEILYGDINLDGSVTGADLLPFISHFLGTRMNDEQCLRANLNLDGEIDLTDLATLKQYIMGDTVSIAGKAAKLTQ